jgi:hypothetical protein
MRNLAANEEQFLVMEQRTGDSVGLAADIIEFGKCLCSSK